ncbi:MAG: hypothetical protein R2709_02880 [Marmoricola sp.]
MKTRNPLRNPLDRRLPHIAGPCGMVLFGVTGDLSKKKVMPAIYDLTHRGLLPPASVWLALPDASGLTRTSRQKSRKQLRLTRAPPSAKRCGNN